jgi:hypothetical protein
VISPNSVFSRMRIFLVRKTQIRPPIGEAWCVNCAANNGRTKILSPDGIKEHVLTHPRGRYIEVHAIWPESTPLVKK